MKKLAEEKEAVYEDECKKDAIEYAREKIMEKLVARDKLEENGKDLRKQLSAHLKF